MPGGEGGTDPDVTSHCGLGPGRTGSWGKQLVPGTQARRTPGRAFSSPVALPTPASGWICPSWETSVWCDSPWPPHGGAERVGGGWLAEASCPRYRPGKGATLRTTKAPSAKPCPALLTAASSRPGYHRPSAGGRAGAGTHRPARPAAREPRRGPSEPQVQPPGPGEPGAVEGPLRTGRGLLELPLGSWGEGAVS